MTCERLVKLGIGLPLVCGLLLVMPQCAPRNGSVRACGRPAFNPMVQMMPNTQMMLMIGGFAGMGGSGMMMGGGGMNMGGMTWAA